ncbi:MAG: hypothetical protein JSS51_04755 [Planctomycetes bacterium]|nr:hypothetical protein [Planctomycetota bacterium]
MQSDTKQREVRALVLAIMAAVGVSVLAGCNSSGQSEVTGSDRPSEGVGWDVQEQMARDRGN